MSPVAVDGGHRCSTEIGGALGLGAEERGREKVNNTFDHSQFFAQVNINSY